MTAWAWGAIDTFVGGEERRYRGFVEATTGPRKVRSRSLGEDGHAPSCLAAGTGSRTTAQPDPDALMRADGSSRQGPAGAAPVQGTSTR